MSVHFLYNMVVLKNQKVAGNKPLLGGYMGQAIHPERGQWYKRLDLDASFEVVAIDRDEQCIEIQYYSGEIEEIDQSSWDQLALLQIAPPDNWSGAFGTDNRIELDGQADSLETALSMMDAKNS